MSTDDRLDAQNQIHFFTQDPSLLIPILNGIRDGIVVINPAGRVIFFNQAAQELTGIDFSSSHPEDWSRRYGVYLPDCVTPFPSNQYPLVRALRGETVERAEQYIKNPSHPEGTFILVTARALRNAKSERIGAVATFQNITESKRLETLENRIHQELETRMAQAANELRQSEQKILQLQKMEAIGSLAGGVAHDFNNLLSVIELNADELLEHFHESSSHRSGIEQIRKAGERGAALTKQLLQFSRQQLIQPKPLNLNSLISDYEKMLRRLIGENIEFTTELTASPGQVFADAGSIGQVIMNLVVNARDAMPKGGSLVIETHNVRLEKSLSNPHFSLEPGPYIQLKVTDSGTGMNEQTLSRIFEPFFSTKGPDKGTGLGLSTVYGIIKQAHGAISVESELGKGTTFEVLLPIMFGDFRENVPTARPPRSRHGAETVLLAEDEGPLRKPIAHILRKSGYHVLEASNGAEALQVALHFEGEIHLVITDVVMPHMSGPDLVKGLLERWPDMGVIYLSGYIGDMFQAQGGVLEPGMEFLEKPFSGVNLLEKVVTVLDPK